MRVRHFMVGAAAPETGLVSVSAGDVHVSSTSGERLRSEVTLESYEPELTCFSTDVIAYLIVSPACVWLHLPLYVSSSSSSSSS